MISFHFHQNSVNIKSKRLGHSLAELNRSAGWSTCNSFTCLDDRIIVDLKSTNVILLELQSLLDYLYYKIVLSVAYRFIHGALFFVRCLTWHLPASLKSHIITEKSLGSRDGK